MLSTTRLYQAQRVAALAIVICALTYTAGAAASDRLRFSPDESTIFEKTQPEDFESRFELAIEEAYFRMLGSGVAVGDIDRDGDLDVVLPGGIGSPDVVYRNMLMEHDGELGWQREPLPTDEDPWRRSAVIADVNNDGRPDIVLHGDGTESHPGSILLLQLESGDWQLTELEGTTPAATSSLVFDFDNDGYIDVLRVAWAMDAVNGDGDIIQTGPLETRTLLDTFAPAQGEQFVTMARSLAAFQRTFMQAVVADFTNTGTFDLFITKDFGPNLYLRPTSDGEFVDIARTVGMDAANSDMGVAVGDIDEDGDLDVFITNIFNTVPGITTEYRNTLHINATDEGGVLTFAEDAIAQGVSATDWAWSSFLVDLDHDGYLDLLVASGAATFADAVGVSDHPVSHTPTYLLFGNGSSFEPLLGTPLDDENDTRVALPADFNRDGAVDILEVHMDAAPRLLLNTTEGLPNALHLILEPDAAAWGARLSADYGTRTLIRDVVAGEGYMSAAPPEVSIPGQLEGAAMQSLEIRWRDGMVTTFSPPPPTGIFRLRRPDCGGAECESSPGWYCEPDTDSGHVVCTLSEGLDLREQFASAGNPPAPAEPVDATETQNSPRGGNGSGCSQADKTTRAPLLSVFALGLVALGRRRRQSMVKGNREHRVNRMGNT